MPSLKFLGATAFAVLGLGYFAHSQYRVASLPATKLTEQSPFDEEDNSNIFERHDHRDYPIEHVDLRYAPNVPPPITREHPVRLRVDMEAYPRVMPIDELNKFEFWTFNGAVPGPMIRARVGDVMELSFTNRDESGMQHNLDFHAVTGPGGGAPLTTSDLNETRFTHFKLLRPGLFIYHCAVDPVGMHIGTGMWGLILVEPKEGLSPADKEFYVVQSDFYTEDKPIEGSDVLDFSMEKGIAEKPTYVVFNGRVGALQNEGTLKAKQGDRIRIFFGNAGPNLVSSFHTIGMIFDKVYREGDLVSPPARHIQTTLVPAGGAVVVEFDAVVPGTYTLVDHSIFRSEKGAAGFLEITGDDKRNDIYSSPHPPKLCPTCKLHP